MTFLTTITFWHWMSLGGLLIIAEAFAPGVMLLWLGIAAASVGLVVAIWPELGLPFQLLLFAALAMGSVVAWRQVGWKPATTDHPALNRRHAAYLGRHATLVDPIVNGFGRVKLGDASWSVAGPDLPAGRTVEIVGASGVVLTVRPVEDPGSGRDTDGRASTEANEDHGPDAGEGDGSASAPSAMATPRAAGRATEGEPRAAAGSGGTSFPSDASLPGLETPL